MKAIVWIISFLSVAAGLFISFVSYLSNGLGLSGTGFGDVVCLLGMFALVAGIVGAVLGIRKLRKGEMKKAIAFALIGVAYCAVIAAGIFIDDAVHTAMHEKSMAELDEQRYGEGWDSAPAIDGIPELYQEVLNKFYAVVRDGWTGGELMDLGAVSMSGYYGDAPLDNIGFTFMDLNGDDVEEMVIGAVAREGQTGNEIFCIYENPENPFYAVCSVDGEVYYLHAGASEGMYEVEIAGYDLAWVINTAEQANTFDFDPREGAMDPEGRITISLTPFSMYK